MKPQQRILQIVPSWISCEIVDVDASSEQSGLQDQMRN